MENTQLYDLELADEEMEQIEALENMRSMTGTTIEEYKDQVMEVKILVLNGSPRPRGSTEDMVNAFKKGAESAGHIVHVVDVMRKEDRWVFGM
jgi:Multimeric flavodoxin WrbA